MDINSMLLGSIEKMLDQTGLLNKQILLVLDNLLQLDHMWMAQYLMITA